MEELTRKLKEEEDQSFIEGFCIARGALKWVNWDDITRRKADSGLDFKEFYNLNLSEDSLKVHMDFVD